MLRVFTTIYYFSSSSLIIVHTFDVSISFLQQEVPPKLYFVTNETLRRHGVRVIEIPSCELSRGRGGPHCMSMALEREDIK